MHQVNTSASFTGTSPRKPMNLYANRAIRTYLSSMYAKWVGLAKNLKHNNRTYPSAILVPPVSLSGSVGDEAMLIGCIAYLKKHGFKRIAIVSFDPLCRWYFHDQVDEVIDFHGKKRAFNFIKSTMPYSHLYCIGADVMDGKYSAEPVLRITRLASLATYSGLQATISGFSFNEQPAPSSTQLLKQLPKTVRLCARDPISHNRLKHFLNRPVELVADLAFLLEPSKLDAAFQPSLEWIKTEKQRGQMIIGININSTFLKLFEDFNKSNLVTAFVNLIETLGTVNSGLSFLLVPHDSRGEVNDGSLSIDVFTNISTEFKPRVHTIPFPCQAGDIKQIASHIDFAITGRMHFAIACLGQGVPVIGMVYQGKFEGLYQHFGLKGLTVEPSMIFDAESLAHQVQTTLPKLPEIRNTILKNLPGVKALARKNLNISSDLYPVNSSSQEVIADANYN
ncbi:MAG: polysaccharide pyruvyl transferase family protein [Leptolyngbyaceae cyanobacterium bins.302]|nr:polysaccharide pyruvyl transferase family protein [Leptolyngbyaceae cyanobacterium bins.302]